MKIKKITALFLMMTFMSLFAAPISNGVCAGGEQMSLSEFLKTTDDIKASYEYPSMKITANSIGKSTIPAHSPIVIRCVDTITTRDIVSGSTVDFVTVSDVKDANGNILIKSNTPVSAQISFKKSRGMVGTSGELTVTDFSTKAIDGTYVPLSGSVSAKPDDKMVMSIVLSVVVCPLFLLMRGEEARLEAGATKTAYTVSDVYVKTDNL